MARSLLGFTNYAATGTLTAGSEASNMGIAAGWTSPHGSASTAWQTKSGITTSANGAWAIVNCGAAVTLRAFLLARTNLSTAATVRWRAGTQAAIIEETPAFDLRFDSGSFTNPTGYNFARSGTTAYYFNASGVLTQATANTLRIQTDPNTGAKYALMEEARINRVPNPRGEGAVVGTPGTRPTGWAPLITSAGLTSSIATAGGSENGFTYSAIRNNGTASAAGFSAIRLVATNAADMATVQNDVWALSCYLKLAAGSWSGVTAVAFEIRECDAGGAVLSTSTVAITSPPTTGLGSYRASTTYTVTQATAAFLQFGIRVSHSNGAAIDWTLAIVPQAEKGAVYPSSMILPPIGAPAATTRNADQQWLSGQSINGAAGWTVCVDITPSTGSGSDVYWGMVPASTLVTDSTYLANTVSSAWHQVAVRDSIHGDWGSSPTRSVADNVAARVVAAADASGTIIAANALGTTTGSGTGLFPGTYTIMGLGGKPDGASPGIATGVNKIRRIAFYTKRLTATQIAALASTGSTLDTAGVAYDSGTISAGIVATIGQSLTVAPADLTAQYVRVDINDSTNPDGFLNIPLAFVGPVWTPNASADPSSAFGRDDRVDDVQTLGGQEWPVLRWHRRHWGVALQAVAQSEVWSQLMPLDLAARSGSNILYVPDTAASDVQKETVFGRLRTTADLTYPTTAAMIRTWRATIEERL